jgi:hypothetical protein
VILGYKRLDNVLVENRTQSTLRRRIDGHLCLPLSIHQFFGRRPNRHVPFVLHCNRRHSGSIHQCIKKILIGPAALLGHLQRRRHSPCLSHCRPPLLRADVFYHLASPLVLNSRFMWVPFDRHVSQLNAGSLLTCSYSCCVGFLVRKYSFK